MIKRYILLRRVGDFMEAMLEFSHSVGLVGTSFSSNMPIEESSLISS